MTQPAAKCSTPTPDSAPSTREIHVVKVGFDWTITRAQGGPAPAFRTQGEARRAAQELLRQTGGVLKIHGADGRIRESLTLGRASMTKINAVEGQALTSRLKREFKTFDTLGLTTAERRRRLKASFGKTPA